jgi:hypothetical protein
MAAACAVSISQSRFVGGFGGPYYRVRRVREPSCIHVLARDLTV